MSIIETKHQTAIVFGRVLDAVSKSAIWQAFIRLRRNEKSDIPKIGASNDLTLHGLSRAVNSSDCPHPCLLGCLAMDCRYVLYVPESFPIDLITRDLIERFERVAAIFEQKNIRFSSLGMHGVSWDSRSHTFFGVFPVKDGCKSVDVVIGPQFAPVDRFIGIASNRSAMALQPWTVSDEVAVSLMLQSYTGIPSRLMPAQDCIEVSERDIQAWPQLVIDIQKARGWIGTDHGPLASTKMDVR